MTRTAEQQLLLACALRSMDAERHVRVQDLIDRGIDWVNLLALAGRHGLMPLLYWHLKEPDVAGVPEAWLAGLKADFMANASWNLALTAELTKILDLFSASGIPAITFKGPTLAAILYDNLALRQFSDVDVLIRPEDLIRVRDLLLVHGYSAWPPLSAAQERFYHRWFNERPFVRADGRVELDLHWRFLPPTYGFSLDLEGLDSRCGSVPVGDRTVRTPVGEDLLLLLCLHSAVSRWERLSLVCEIAELIRQDDIDWNRLFGKADQGGSTRLVGASLGAARDLQGAVLPPDVARRLAEDRRTVELAAKVCRQIFLPPGLGKESLYFKALTWRDQCRYCVFPTNQEIRAIRLPAWLTGFYFLVRPLRLAGKAAAIASGKILPIVKRDR